MVAYPYDIKFTIGANSYGFMCVTPPQQTKSLNVTEIGGPDSVRLMMRGMSEQEANHLDFDPTKDTPFAMADFSGGLGQLEFDGQDDSAYWWGNVCTHVSGRAYLPPSTSSLALPSGTTALTGVYTYITPANTRWDFAWAGVYLWRRDASNSTNMWTLLYTAAQSITDFTVFNGNGLIAFAADTTTTDFVTVTTIADAPGFTNRDHAVFSSGNKPKFWITSRSTLFACVDSGKVYLTVDPTQDAWLGPIQTTVGGLNAPEVGDRSYPFVHAIAVNDYVFVFRTDAGYNIDADQNVSETFWQWKDKPSFENFKYIAAGAEFLFYSIGPEVYFYDPTSGANTPMRLARRDGFSIQSILGLSADNQYVYVLAQVRVPKLRNTSSVALLRGARVAGARWAFECLWEDTSLAGKSYTGLKAAPNGVGTRLYWGLVTGGAASTILMDIPADWDESTGSSFATTGDLFISITRANHPGFAKRHLWVSLEAEGTSVGGSKVAVAYSTDYGATFTSLGDTDTASGGILKLEYSNVHSRSIVLKFTLSGNGTATPVLRVFDHHQRVRFRYLQTVTVGVRVATNLQLLNGSNDTQRPITQLHADLDTIRQSEATILYEDFLGNSFNVSLDSLAYRPTRHESPTGKGEIEALLVANRADSGA